MNFKAPVVTALLLLRHSRYYVRRRLFRAKRAEEKSRRRGEWKRGGNNAGRKECRRERKAQELAAASDNAPARSRDTRGGVGKERREPFRRTASLSSGRLCRSQHAGSGRLAGTPEIMFNRDRCKMGGAARGERRREWGGEVVWRASAAQHDRGG